MSEEEKFFRITYQEISIDDIKAWMLINKTSIPDEALSDGFMQKVADEMGNLLIDEKWLEVLDGAVRETCDLFGIDIKNVEENK